MFLFLGFFSAVAALLGIVEYGFLVGIPIILLCITFFKIHSMNEELEIHRMQIENLQKIIKKDGE